MSILSWITYVLPIITILLIALFYYACPSLKTAKLESRGKRSTGVRDMLVLGVILIVYSAVAFYNLGDENAPQSFHRFDAGEQLMIDLGSEKQISEIMYYTGLNTGEYTVEYSHDRVFWFKAAELDQAYDKLFKWEQAEFVDTLVNETQYMRITADGELYLGELAIKDADGTMLDYTCTGPALHDEQELVPEHEYYLNGTYFDEIYHARTAFENIQGIYPYEITHPPLGKLIIAIGIELFGMTPFGWRFSGVMFGIAMLPVLYMLLKKMFGGIAVPACGTLIFAFDFMHFTQTRIATIDTYAVFFILLMYLFMYLYTEGGKPRHLALSGLFFGLGAASKWTCIYAGGGLAILWLIHWIREFKSGKKAGDFIKNCLFCLVFFVVIPCAIYYASYFPYAQARGMHGAAMFFTKDYADIVLKNQQYMLSYHQGVHSSHPYASHWYQWILDLRPILYYLHYFDDATRSSFGAFLNPVLCWAGLVAVFITGYLAIFRRDRLSVFITVGFIAQLLPWVFITRTTFAYHYFPSAVFLLLAICRVFSLMRTNIRHWRMNVYGLTALALALFVLFYPVLSGMRVNELLAIDLLRWLPSWPF